MGVNIPFDTVYQWMLRLLAAEYTCMFILSCLSGKSMGSNVYWFGAVILQLGIMWGLK